VADAPANEWALYRRLVGHVRPYWPRLTLGALFCLLFAGSSTGLIYGARKFFDRVFNPLESSLTEVLLAAALLSGLGLLRGVGDFIGRYLIEWVGNRVVMDLRNGMFARLQELSLGYFTHQRTGELISRVSNDSALVERAVATVLTDIFKQPVVLLGAAGTLIWLNPGLAALTLLAFPLCIVPIALFGRRVRRAARLGQQHLADLLSVAQEAIAGARVVKAFGAEDYERGRFARQAQDVFRRVMQVTRARVASEQIVVELGILGVSLVLVYAWWTRMSVGDFFAFALALMLMYDPAKKLGNIHLTIQHSAAASERIFAVMDEPVTVMEAPDAAPFDPPLRAITFDRVGFAYEREPVLADISLDVAAGERIALVGSSGSGKTTLISLLPRFFDVTTGRLLINGRDARELQPASWRRQIGLVTQDTFLFNDTVARNIAYGAPDATPAQIERAARQAHAHEFIAALPEGYETMIGERGARLSGGQCQRLALARAVLRNPPLLILDEATSALDTESERQVQTALDAVMRERTVFVIAHRLSTVVNATRIVVLDRGRIAEIGTHAELLARGGIYRRLYELQFQDAPAGR